MREINVIDEGRNSNFELLRIVSIFMIIGYHYVVHGHFSNEQGVLNSILLDSFSSCGKIGVNIFCLLMGFFGITSHGVSTKKILSFEIQVLFYSLFGLGIGFVFDRELLSIKTYALSLFPTITEHYWFFSAYIIVYALSNFINTFLRNLQKREYICLLLFCYMVWSVIPFFSLREAWGMFWNQLIWFFVMYITGAYLQLYKNKRLNGKKILVVLVTSLLVLNFSFIVLELINSYHPIPDSIITYFRWSNSPIAITASVSLFIVCCDKDPYSNKVINKIGGLVFGIYLFHENVIIQDILWGKILNASSCDTAKSLVFHFLTSIIIVFILGSVIELVRSFFKKHIWNLLDYMSKKYDLQMNAIVNFLDSRL